jgi:hypothetical protein
MGVNVLPSFSAALQYRGGRLSLSAECCILKASSFFSRLPSLVLFSFLGFPIPHAVLNLNNMYHVTERRTLLLFWRQLQCFVTFPPKRGLKQQH